MTLLRSFTLTLLLACGSPAPSSAPSGPEVDLESVSATTKDANAKLQAFLDFDDTRDFTNAERGLIAKWPEDLITDDKGNPSYDLTAYDFIQGDPPETVNPSLWRQSKLITKPGLYQVNEKIYQIRAFDLANMSFMRGEKGWIVVDPLTANETAKAGLKLLRDTVEDLPVTAIIITHSHVDHFGGVGAILEDANGPEKPTIIAPIGFFDDAISENVFAGNAMARRAFYMYGNGLPKNAEGTLGSGLGTTTPTGEVTIATPDVEISETPTNLKVDGLDLQFLYTPGAEAPTELMFYIPSMKTMCQAEEINHTLHNLYTLRGAKVRSGLEWSKYIHDTIRRYGDEVEVSFGSHHWPTWGNEEIVELWTNQRDVYRYIHDETLRLGNMGLNKEEIAEALKLPEPLAKTWANRGYYGSVSHNAKAQYQLYWGWFDGNPANLNPLPQVDEAKKLVEYMGGSDAVLAKARKDYNDGQYRFVATALNHVVFAEPDNQTAKDLLAATYTQLGYQAESGPWRNFYLTGAAELRRGLGNLPSVETASPSIVNNLPLDVLLDYLGILLNGPDAASQNAIFHMVLPDVNQKATLYVSNGTLHYTLDVLEGEPTTTLTLDRATLNLINLKQLTFQQAAEEGKLKIEGDQKALMTFFSHLDTFEFWYPIVTP